MKKILFCLQTMVCGGVEKELVTILNRFDKTKYDITFLLMYIEDEEIIKTVPKGIKIINLNLNKNSYFLSFRKLLLKKFSSLHLIEGTKLLYYKTVKNINPVSKMDFDNLPKIDEEFDCAVCYHAHSPFALRYVSEKVSAKKKILWIHNDFSTTGYTISDFENHLENYDLFVGVSDQLTSEFTEICPQFKNKSKTVFNIVDKDEIKEKSELTSDIEPEFLNDKRIKIVTVGRFVEQKGFDIAVKSCKILANKGKDISWYAIGYGKEEDNIRRLIKENKIADRFFILGKKNNPYPYMKNADIYVQPSRHEGYAITIEEAKALQCLIVCQNFAGASQQIKNGETGIIAPSATPDDISEAILKLLDNKELYEKISNNIKNNSADFGWDEIERVFNDEK